MFCNQSTALNGKMNWAVPCMQFIVSFHVLGSEPVFFCSLSCLNDKFVML